MMVGIDLPILDVILILSQEFKPRSPSVIVRRDALLSNSQMNLLFKDFYRLDSTLYNQGNYDLDQLNLVNSSK